MQDFRKLVVWQRAHALSIAVYRATESMPPAELYAMRRQIRNASVSVEANIAEGCGRRTGAELLNFLGISSGSLCELQCLLMLACDLGFLPASAEMALQREIVVIRKMLVRLKDRVRAARSRETFQTANRHKTPNSPPNRKPAPATPARSDRKRGREAPQATENERSE